MSESQYVDSYLDCEGQYTIKTFLHYRLKGRAKDYSQRYEQALQRAINRRIASGEVKECVSSGNRTAYKRVEHAN